MCERKKPFRLVCPGEKMTKEVFLQTDAKNFCSLKKKKKRKDKITPVNPLPVDELPKKQANYVWVLLPPQLLLSNLSSAVSLTETSPVSNISVCKPWPTSNETTAGKHFCNQSTCVKHSLHSFEFVSSLTLVVSTICMSPCIKRQQPQWVEMANIKQV